MAALSVYLQSTDYLQSTVDRFRSLYDELRLIAPGNFLQSHIAILLCNILSDAAKHLGDTGFGKDAESYNFSSHDFNVIDKELSNIYSQVKDVELLKIAAASLWECVGTCCVELLPVCSGNGFQCLKCHRTILGQAQDAYAASLDC